jgi:hypothetical protein
MLGSTKMITSTYCTSSDGRLAPGWLQSTATCGAPANLLRLGGDSREELERDWEVVWDELGFHHGSSGSFMGLGKVPIGISFAGDGRMQRKYWHLNRARITSRWLATDEGLDGVEDLAVSGLRRRSRSATADVELPSRCRPCPQWEERRRQPPSGVWYRNGIHRWARPSSVLRPTGGFFFFLLIPFPITCFLFWKPN